MTLIWNTSELSLQKFEVKIELQLMATQCHLILAMDTRVNTCQWVIPVYEFYSFYLSLYNNQTEYTKNN